jgi:hypothetical protein
MEQKWRIAWLLGWSILLTFQKLMISGVRTCQLAEACWTRDNCTCHARGHREAALLATTS